MNMDFGLDLVCSLCGRKGGGCVRLDVDFLGGGSLRVFFGFVLDLGLICPLFIGSIGLDLISSLSFCNGGNGAGFLRSLMRDTLNGLDSGAPPLIFVTRGLNGFLTS